MWGVDKRIKKVDVQEPTLKIVYMNLLLKKELKNVEESLNQ